MRSGVGYRLKYFTNPGIRWASDTHCHYHANHKARNQVRNLTQTKRVFCAWFFKVVMWEVQHFASPLSSFSNIERTMTHNGHDALCLSLTGGRQSGTGTYSKSGAPVSPGGMESPPRWWTLTWWWSICMWDGDEFCFYFHINSPPQPPHK